MPWRRAHRRPPSADDAAPSLRVRLADGAEHVVPAADPHGVLARIHRERCFAERVGHSAALRLGDGLRPGPTPDTAIVSLTATAAGTSGRTAEGVVLDSVSPTTLLGEDPRYPWPRGVVLGPAGATVALTVRPARCDPHAVAEDKVGTLIRPTLTLSSGGASETGTVQVAASPSLRAALHDFVARACGWPAAP